MEIEFTKADLEFIDNLAHQRNDPKVAANVPDYKMDDKKTDFQVHYEGLIGECAVSKYLELPIDTSISLGGDDHGSDMDIPNVGSAEIRFRAKPWYEFALNTCDIEDFVCDIGIIVVPVKPSFRPTKVNVKGWVTKDRFIEKCHQDNFGYGDILVIKDKFLFPIEELRKKSKLEINFDDIGFVEIGK